MQRMSIVCQDTGTTSRHKYASAAIVRVAHIPVHALSLLTLLAGINSTLIPSRQEWGAWLALTDAWPSLLLLQVAHRVRDVQSRCWREDEYSPLCSRPTPAAIADAGFLGLPHLPVALCRSSGVLLPPPDCVYG